MAKIFDVDFKQKQINFTFEDGIKKDDINIRRLMVNFADSLNVINSTTKDRQYVESCAEVFRNILIKIRQS